MLEKVKLALPVTSNAYDNELNSLISAALLDLGIAGVTGTEGTTITDELIIRAVITYCRVHFGSPPDYVRLKAAYDEQKAQLMSATGYTDWGDGNDES